MATYDLIVVEEVGLVDAELFERLLRLWDAAARRPALVFVGDFRQLKNMNGWRACESWHWSTQVFIHELRTMRRCKCPILKEKLELLRSHTPSAGQLKRILKGHRAPYPIHREYQNGSDDRRDPTANEIGAIFDETPNTMFITISRSKAAWVNDMAIQHFFWNAMRQGVVPADPESNMDNYDGTVLNRHEPSALPIYIGMRVTFTLNVRPEVDFVNGQDGIVKMMDNAKVLVETYTGHMVPVFPHWDEKHWATFYPIRPAYASTLMKMQGATIQHMTMWLDSRIEAGGYVALPRVQHDADWRFVGDLTPSHFWPAEL
jgi:hypothetical protein